MNARGARRPVIGHLQLTQVKYLLGRTDLIESVDRAVRASDQEADRLEMTAGDPMLEIAQVGFLDDGTPFEYSVSRNVGDRYELRDVNVI